MNISELERENLHKLLDKMIDDDEDVGYMQFCEVYKPIKRFRLILKYDEQQWYSDVSLRIPDGT